MVSKLRPEKSNGTWELDFLKKIFLTPNSEVVFFYNQ